MLIPAQNHLKSEDVFVQAERSTRSSVNLTTEHLGGVVYGADMRVSSTRKSDQVQSSGKYQQREGSTNDRQTTGRNNACTHARTTPASDNMLNRPIVHCAAYWKHRASEELACSGVVSGSRHPAAGRPSEPAAVHTETGCSWSQAPPAPKTRGWRRSRRPVAVGLENRHVASAWSTSKARRSDEGWSQTSRSAFSAADRQSPPLSPLSSSTSKQSTDRRRDVTSYVTSLRHQVNNLPANQCLLHVVKDQEMLYKYRLPSRTMKIVYSEVETSISNIFDWNVKKVK